MIATALAAQSTSQNQQFARDVLQQLIEINTTDSVGSTTMAAAAMAKRFREAGFPAEDIFQGGPNDRKGNLVVRYRGAAGKKPILLIGHLDVVEARREDWTTDPFQLVEKDGFYYGRGTQDMKGGCAIMVANLIRLHQEGYRPDRDIILALTADEEGGSSNGVDWLLKNHRELIDADFVINHDTDATSENGKVLTFTVDATEKLYGDFQFKVTNHGGHSSIPIPDNAIYHLANALTRVEKFRFPFELNSVTRGYFEEMAKHVEPKRAADMRAVLQSPPDAAAVARLTADPLMNSIMRTNCVATRLAAGHANNALPQTATANVNCRIMPGHSREEVRQKLVEVIADRQVGVTYVTGDGTTAPQAPGDRSLPPPPLRADVFDPLRAVVNETWPGVPVLPDMSAGASDGVYTNAAGMPTYAISGIVIESNDVRAHGKDERIGVRQYDQGVDFFYRYLKALTGGR